MKEKSALIRVARAEGGAFSPDFTGKKPGRGAYICRSPACLAVAHRKKGLERSFRQAVPPEVYEFLNEEINQNG